MDGGDRQVQVEMIPPRLPKATTVPIAAFRLVSLVELMAAHALQRAPNETVEATRISERTKGKKDKTQKLQWR